MNTFILLICFWTMQIGANLLFKMGADSSPGWWVGFFAGNILGMSSIYFLMSLYTRMDVNLALAIASGGSFILVQIAMALVFNGRPSNLQWIGFLLVAFGMLLGSLGAKKVPVVQEPISTRV